MQTSLAEKALSQLKLAISSSKTNHDDELFQLAANALDISQFIAEVILSQSEETLECLSWHYQHDSSKFANYLNHQITRQLYADATDSYDQRQPSKSLYKAEYLTEISIMAYLRKFRRRHSAAIAILELTGKLSIEESMSRMSFLAEVLTHTAYLWSYAEQQSIYGEPSNFASDSQELDSSSKITIEEKETPIRKALHQNMLILAMGKFGGNELNFSSDIDLIFFYSNSGQTFGGRRQIDNSRFFQKVGVVLIRLLNEKTQDGFVFRVDMRLRPYGDSGNLVMSISQAEDYYQEQGRDWERFAMVRARIITGSVEEKRALQNIITPFAFRRYIDYGVIDALRNMKQMIQREVRRRGLIGNIKLGAGGIREIEFMVQSLQLIQGGRNKKLQEKSLLSVLPILVEEKLIPQQSADELAGNYRFLRRLENCLQEVEEKQTQQLPKNSKAQENIAAVMGTKNWQVFNQQLEAIQVNTNKHFNELFGEEISKGEQQDDFWVSLWEGHINSALLEEKIVRLENYHSSDKCKPSENIILLLTQFRDSNLIKNLSAKGNKRLKIFFPALLKITMETDQPDKTLANILVVLKSILRRTAYLELLSENLPILQHLVDLVSRSDWIVQRLSESPILFDELLYPNSLYDPLLLSDLKNELRQSMLRIDSGDEEQLLDAIRQFKQINELRVAAALMSERLNISQISRYLTQLAEVIIQAAVNYCWQKLVEKQGVPEGINTEINPEHTLAQIGFVVIAYGKLGGLELGFNSDLDLVFLFDGALESKVVKNNTVDGKNLSISRFYTRLAQKTIHFLSTRMSMGVLYDVDMRLRPSGNSGLLVSHIDAFNDYQIESAWTWEHQALVRARVVAGDSRLAKKFSTIRENILNTKHDNATLKTDVVDMRSKMRSELNKSVKSLSATSQFDIKQGVGGLVDIEFISQYLLLSSSHQSIPPTNTAEALKFSQKEGLIADKEAQTLIKVYRLYRNYLNEMALVTDDRRDENGLFESERKKVIEIWNKTF